MGWLRFWKTKAEPARLEWRAGLHRNGGETLVQQPGGLIRGHAYKLGSLWWAVVDYSARGEYVSMEDAKRAVEREVMRKHILTCGFL